MQIALREEMTRQNAVFKATYLSDGLLHAALFLQMKQTLILLNIKRAEGLRYGRCRYRRGRVEQLRRSRCRSKLGAERTQHDSNGKPMHSFGDNGKHSQNPAFE